MDKRTPSMIMPAFIGGAVAGFVAGLPILGMLNCACCALVIGGGLLAAYLYSKACRTAGVEFAAGSGALVGLVAGLFYAPVAAIVSTVVAVLTGQTLEQAFASAREYGMEVPPEAEGFIEFLEGAGIAVQFLLSLVVSIVCGLIFSTIGGLIGGAAFKYTPAPPAPPPPPIPTWEPPPPPPAAPPTV